MNWPGGPAHNPVRMRVVFFDWSQPPLGGGGHRWAPHPRARVPPPPHPPHPLAPHAGPGPHTRRRAAPGPTRGGLSGWARAAPHSEPGPARGVHGGAHRLPRSSATQSPSGCPSPGSRSLGHSPSWSSVVGCGVPVQTRFAFPPIRGGPGATPIVLARVMLPLQPRGPVRPTRAPWKTEKPASPPGRRRSTLPATRLVEHCAQGPARNAERRDHVTAGTSAPWPRASPPHIHAHTRTPLQNPRTSSPELPHVVVPPQLARHRLEQCYHVPGICNRFFTGVADH